MGNQLHGQRTTCFENTAPFGVFYFHPNGGVNLTPLGPRHVVYKASEPDSKKKRKNKIANYLVFSILLVDFPYVENFA